jgi:hypothetical protein
MFDAPPLSGCVITLPLPVPCEIRSLLPPHVLSYTQQTDEEGTRDESAQVLIRPVVTALREILFRFALQYQYNTPVVNAIRDRFMYVCMSVAVIQVQPLTRVGPWEWN